jgi:hypothetical protein
MHEELISAAWQVNATGGVPRVVPLHAWYILDSGKGCMPSPCELDGSAVWDLDTKARSANHASISSLSCSTEFLEPRSTHFAPSFPQYSNGATMLQ